MCLAGSSGDRIREFFILLRKDLKIITVHPYGSKLLQTNFTLLIAVHKIMLLR